MLYFILFRLNFNFGRTFAHTFRSGSCGRIIDWRSGGPTYYSYDKPVPVSLSKPLYTLHGTVSPPPLCLDSVTLPRVWDSATATLEYLSIVDKATLLRSSSLLLESFILKQCTVVKQIGQLTTVLFIAHVLAISRVISMYFSLFSSMVAVTNQIPLLLRPYAPEENIAE